MEYDFECVEVELDDVFYYCEGTIEFEIEDGAVGYVPYGDTQVWHPGEGDCIDVESVTVTEVTNDDGIVKTDFFAGHQKWMKQLEEAISVKLCDGDTLHDYAAKAYEDDEVDRAYMARKLGRWRNNDAM